MLFIICFFSLLLPCDLNAVQSLAATTQRTFKLQDVNSALATHKLTIQQLTEANIQEILTAIRKAPGPQKKAAAAQAVSTIAAARQATATVHHQTNANTNAAPAPATVAAQKAPTAAPASSLAVTTSTPPTTPTPPAATSAHHATSPSTLPALPDLSDGDASDDEERYLQELEKRKREIQQKKLARIKAHNAAQWAAIEKISPNVLHPLLKALQNGQLQPVALWLNRQLSSMNPIPTKTADRIQRLQTTETGNYLMFLYYLSKQNLSFTGDRLTLTEALKKESVQHTSTTLDGLWYDIGRKYNHDIHALSPEQFDYTAHIHNSYAPPPPPPTRDPLAKDHAAEAAAAVRGRSVKAQAEAFEKKPVMGVQPKPLTAQQRRDRENIEAVKRMQAKKTAAPPAAVGKGMNLGSDFVKALKTVRRANESDNDDDWSDSDNEAAAAPPPPPPPAHAAAPKPAAPAKAAPPPAAAPAGHGALLDAIRARRKS